MLVLSRKGLQTPFKLLSHQSTISLKKYSSMFQIAGIVLPADEFTRYCHSDIQFAEAHPEALEDSHGSLAKWTCDFHLYP